MALTQESLSFSERPKDAPQISPRPLTKGMMKAMNVQYLYIM